VPNRSEEEKNMKRAKGWMEGPSSVLHRLLLLGDTDSLALVASGLGVLAADTQAPASFKCFKTK
jgi:hypothetical protein